VSRGVTSASGYPRGSNSNPAYEEFFVIRRVVNRGVVRLTFSLPTQSVTGPVSVVGNFNEWTPGRHELKKRSNGTHSVSLEVAKGTRVHFRYLGEDGRWFDDETADVRDGHGCYVLT
jgi:1,4-alpha-glucan branching enzyme